MTTSSTVLYDLILTLCKLCVKYLRRSSTKFVIYVSCFCGEESFRPWVFVFPSTSSYSGGTVQQTAEGNPKFAMKVILNWLDKITSVPRLLKGKTDRTINYILGIMNGKGVVAMEIESIESIESVPGFLVPSRYNFNCACTQIFSVRFVHQRSRTDLVHDGAGYSMAKPNKIAKDEKIVGYTAGK